MRVVRFLLVSLLACLTAALQAGDVRCDGGVPNTLPVYSSPPTLLNTSANGKLYRTGFSVDDIHVLHVYGTPYQQGYAQGVLMRRQLQNVSTLLYTWLTAQAEHAVPWLPKPLASLIVTLGVEWALQMSFNWTRPFIPQRYMEEMQGIADGAGVNVKDIQNLNQFPELTKAACTVVGATNQSTPTRRVMHLRGLDFTPTCPIADYPQVTVYHNPDGTAVANFGWTGMIGSLTGFSSTGIGVGEKVWDQHPPGIEGVHGKPWMFILRDALHARTTQEAVNSICSSNRTCAIHVGIGDSTTNTFRGLTIAKEECNVYTDTTLNYGEHPILPGIVYWDKHDQPTSSYCLSDLLQKYYGSIDASILATKVAAIGATGNMHAAAFDYATQEAYFAVARRSYRTDGQLNAYARHFTKFDMKALFAEK